MNVNLLGVCMVLSHLAGSSQSRSPLIIVPGMIGSKIEAKLNKTSSPYFYCKKQTDWFTLWLNFEIFSELGDHCLVENTKLVYDPHARAYSNNQGVETRVSGFGNTSSIEYLDELNLIVPYFHEMIRYFTEIGYRVGEDLRGAPYDWRYAADGQVKNGYYTALQKLIDDTYMRNNNTPVTLVTHSMGGPITHYFLSHFVTQEWKVSHIKQFISLSGVFGGSVKALKALVSGEAELAKHFVSSQSLRELGRSLPSLVWLIPSSLWNNTEVVLTTGRRNYTARDVLDLFNDLDYVNGTRMYKELRNISDDFSAPNVTHYCFYGNKVNTIERLVYGDNFPDKDPVYESTGDGDGTVNIRSLESCSVWKSRQKYAVYLKSFDGVKHFSIVKNKDVLREIEKLVT